MKLIRAMIWAHIVNKIAEGNYHGYNHYIKKKYMTKNDYDTAEKILINTNSTYN